MNTSTGHPTTDGRGDAGTQAADNPRTGTVWQSVLGRAARMAKSIIGAKPKRASTLDIRPAPPKADRDGLAIVAIMKNETDYVADWVRFHLLAGAAHIYLYDDGSDDDSVNQAVAAGGDNVSVIPWRMSVSIADPTMTVSRQVFSYAHAVDNFGADFRWMAFLDIDEFLVPVKDASLMEALQRLEQFTSLSLPWTMFGPNGHKLRPSDPVPFAFTSRARHRTGALLNFKCIVDPCDLKQMRVHRCQTQSMGATSANDAGRTAHNKRRSDRDFATAEVLQLNHYYTRSTQELTEKLDKGAVSGSAYDKRRAAVMKKLQLIEADPVEDRVALDFLARLGIHDAMSFRAPK